MTDWFHTTEERSNRLHFDASSCGNTCFANARSAGLAAPPSDSTPRKTRESTLRIFVSTTAMRSPNAKLITALAV